MSCGWGTDSGVQVPGSELGVHYPRTHVAEKVDVVLAVEGCVGLRRHDLVKGFRFMKDSVWRVEG